MLWNVLVALLVVVPALGNSALTLKDVRSRSEGSTFIAELEFNQAISPENINVDFINQTIQIDVPHASIPGGKRADRVAEKTIRSLYTYQVAKDTLRTRIIYNGIDVLKFKDSVRVSANGNNLIVQVQDPKVMEKKAVSLPPKKIQSLNIKPRNLSENSLEDTEIERLMKERDQENAKKELAKNAKDQSIESLDESQIPLFSAKTEKTAKKGKTSETFFVAMALIVILGLGGLWLLRRWSRSRNKLSGNNAIKVLTQHYLGPKKSLAIVRVAGESILIGVTDNNISMIKSLALLDEEVPTDTPQHFNQAFQDAAQENYQHTENAQTRQQTGQEDFAMGHIKDFVTGQLKGKRSI